MRPNVSNTAVALEGVSKRYRQYAGSRDRLVEALSFGRMERGRDFWALKDVSLRVEPGTALGILGRNGAGKSTLLSVMSGVLRPTRGSVAVNGRLVALLQLGAGFKQEYTGRENALLNGLILGMTRKEIMGRFDEIEAFADLGGFMDQPVKTYSSGMRARLGFAVAVNVEPDVLLVDETLSVGDAVFRHQGMRRMWELKEEGATILFVSHGLEMIRDFCNEAVLLHEGRLLAHGEADDTIDRYETLVSEIEAAKKTVGEAGPGSGVPGPARAARIESVEVRDARGLLAKKVDPGSPLLVRARLRYEEEVPRSSLRVALRSKAGLEVFSTSTDLEGRRIGPRRAGEVVVVDFALENVPLRRGTYDVAVVLAETDGEETYLDRSGTAAIFEVANPSDRGAYRGLVHLPVEVEVSSPDRAGSPGL
jgi:ABC-type polysaccharide/polyol phosphate transport system ATPase subunit